MVGYRIERTGDVPDDENGTRAYAIASEWASAHGLEPDGWKHWKAADKSSAVK